MFVFFSGSACPNLSCQVTCWLYGLPENRTHLCCSVDMKYLNLIICSIWLPLDTSGFLIDFIYYFFESVGSGFISFPEECFFGLHKTISIIQADVHVAH